MYTKWFDNLDSADVPQVGGKNASLGEMISALKSEGVKIPGGFATTAKAYRDFTTHNDIKKRIKGLLSRYQKGEIELEKAGKKIRDIFIRAEFPKKIEKKIIESYQQLSDKYNTDDVDVAVRSSATPWPWYIMMI